MSESLSQLNTRRLYDAHEAVSAGHAALSSLRLAAICEREQLLNNAQKELKAAADRIEATLPAAIELLQVAKPANAAPIVVNGKKYAAAHQAVAELTRNAVEQVEAVQQVIADDPDDKADVLSGNLKRLGEDYDVELSAELEIEKAQALRVTDEWMPADWQPDAATNGAGPTTAELDALRAWQTAIEDSHGLDSNSSLRDVWRYITSAGVEVNGEPYEPPQSFDAWCKARQRAMSKMGHDSADK